MAEKEIGRHGPRLGYCEVCDIRAAIYTCPKCELKTCSLECVRVHKTELNCDGLRDRAKFIRINDFTDRDYFQDYQMLEECARFVFAVKRDEKKKFTRLDKELPIHLFRLKMAARERGVALQFLAQNFTRHRLNTTRLDYKTNLISWRVEWIFANAEPALKIVDKKCLETVKLAVLLDKHLGEDLTVEGGPLAPYKAVGYPGIKVLMRAEKQKGCVHKFYELDMDESLAECLSGKCVVEYPTFIVVYKDHAYNFEIITDKPSIFELKTIALDNSFSGPLHNEAVATLIIWVTTDFDARKAREASLDVPAFLEPTGIARDDGNRPDGYDVVENSFLQFIKYIIKFNEETASDTIEARLMKQQYLHDLFSLTKAALINNDRGIQETENMSTDEPPASEPEAPVATTSAGALCLPNSSAMEASAARALESPQDEEDLNWLFYEGLWRAIGCFDEFQMCTFQSKVIQFVQEIKYGFDPQVPALTTSANQEQSTSSTQTDDDVILTADGDQPNTATKLENDNANNAGSTENRHFNTRKRQLLTEKVAIQKEKEIQKEIEEERRKKPRNLLFTSGFSSDEELDLSD